MCAGSPGLTALHSAISRIELRANYGRSTRNDAESRNAAAFPQRCRRDPRCPARVVEARSFRAMNGRPDIDLDALAEEWQLALDSADDALVAAAPTLPEPDV